MIIIALVALLFLSGDTSLDLSDPAVLAEFSANVGTIVKNPAKAGKVVTAAEEISTASREMRSGIDGRVEEAREIAISYSATRDDLNAVFDAIETDIFEANRQIIASREQIRSNVTKKEWKKLVKVVK